MSAESTAPALAPPPDAIAAAVFGARLPLAQRYAELYNAYRNPLADEFQQAKKQLEGLERYLIQLWREYLSPRRPDTLSGARGVSSHPGPSAGPGRTATRVGHRPVTRIRVPAPRPPG